MVDRSTMVQGRELRTQDFKHALKVSHLDQHLSTKLFPYLVGRALHNNLKVSSIQSSQTLAYRVLHVLPPLHR